MKKQKKRTRSTRALSLSVAALAVAVIVVGGAMLWQGMRGGKTNVASGEGVSLDANVAKTVDATPAPQEPGIVIPGGTALSLPAGATEAEVSLPNPEENEGWYYIAYELRLKRPEDAPEDAPEEVIFTTGLIPPGMSCSKVTLTRPLEKGEYPAVLRVQPYRMNDSRTPTNNAELDIVLTVR